MPIKKLLLIVVVFLFTLSNGFLEAPKPAIAGTNGQQLVVYTATPSCRLTQVIVSGMNQNNSRVTWSRTYNPPTQVAITDNWWWKGVVEIRYKAQKNGRDIGWGTLYQSVPTNGSYYKDKVYVEARC